MLRSMYSGISGLRNHHTMMDVVGNNIANVNTAGYKGSSTVFQDVLSQTLQGANAPRGAAAASPTRSTGIAKAPTTSSCSSRRPRRSSRWSAACSSPRRSSATS